MSLITVAFGTAGMQAQGIVLFSLHLELFVECEWLMISVRRTFYISVVRA